jgi:glycosyltransferase involved in cell wall biosynthesis
VADPIRVLELRSVHGTGGGPDKTILLGAQRADPGRFAVTVAYLRDRRDRTFHIDARAEALGVDYIELIERHSYDPGIWGSLRRLVRERRITIVHAHEYKTDLLAWRLARAEPIIPLATVHGWFGRDTWRERLYYAVDKRILARFPRLIAVSSGLKDELVRTGSRKDAITVIPNGIDPRAFVRVPERRPAIRAALGFADEDIVVGAVGRLERQKRLDLLLRAVAGLRNRHPRLRLAIVGDGGLHEELLTLRDALQLGDACLFLGHRNDVPDLHHAFDVFVQASDREGSPNVVLEAMALETPVIATAAGGTTDAITDGMDGLIVAAGSEAALAGAIECVLGNWPAARARAAAARRRVETQLSFDRRMDQVEAIYEELVASRRSSGWAVAL